MSTIEKALDKLNQQQSSASQSQPDLIPAAPVDVVAAEAPSASGEAGIAVPSAVEPSAVEPSADRQSGPESQHVAPGVEKNVLHIDTHRLSALNFVANVQERKLIYEEYRVIKRKLINNAFGPLNSTLRHPNLILVSSSRPGEGKTFTSVNLALSIALEQDKTVLLIDADVLRPNVSRTLDIQVPVGLTDYLSSDNVSVSDIMYSTNVDRLKLIAAGKPHHLSTELLASDKMIALVAEFASRYPDRIVIFDAPPLLGVNETAVLAGMCGQAVIVVEEKRTKLNELEKAISLLPPELAVGFVINKAHYSRDKGYGYGYGYYAGE